MASNPNITVTIVTNPEFLTFEQAAHKFADLVFAALRAGADPPSVQMEPFGSHLLLRTVTTTAAASVKPIEVRIIGQDNGDANV